MPKKLCKVMIREYLGQFDRIGQVFDLDSLTILYGPGVGDWTRGLVYIRAKHNGLLKLDDIRFVVEKFNLVWHINPDQTGIDLLLDPHKSKMPVQAGIRVEILGARQ